MCTHGRSDPWVDWEKGTKFFLLNFVLGTGRPSVREMEENLKIYPSSLDAAISYLLLL